MNDDFLLFFPWFEKVLNRNISDCFDEGTIWFTIINEMKENWGKMDTIALLNGLTEKFGNKGYESVDRYLEFIISKDWGETGKKMAHEGTEIDDFIKLLWEPLKPLGFEYDMEKKGKDAIFCVNKCPIFELAEKTGMHKWLYHLACQTDFYSATSFSKRINFKRTKTLIDGDEYCDHQYYYKGD